ncbi:hypothetical protein OHS71_08330 [Streptomyces sp. NBC_00377]|uniref:hypothetical protein n=1 Tax=unclassified Streptomyces TaxID=2593676 RepID=UPI002E20A499|nr:MULTISPECIES: hypothetical protein [unclassified Streptomyces]
MLDEFRPARGIADAEFRPARGIADAGDTVLLGLALAAVISGLWLSHRMRPPHRIRELQRQAARQKGKRP